MFLIPPTLITVPKRQNASVKIEQLASHFASKSKMCSSKTKLSKGMRFTFFSIYHKLNKLNKSISHTRNIPYKKGQSVVGVLMRKSCKLKTIFWTNPKCRTHRIKIFWTDTRSRT